ncbi:MAG: hypothetical protein M1839_000158 [Geoglossum umbratile]|nr:MAG: hypothetical protein M1839_000158 [Geoglossum umbratile]
MSTYELEAEIAQVAEPSALPILRHTLDRSREGRYRVRDRREQFLGEFVSSWHRLQSTLRRANRALTHLPSPAARQRLYLELQEGTAVSRSAARALAAAIPTANSLSRTRERSDYFLDNIFEGYEIRGYIDIMHTMAIRLQDATTETADDGDMPRASEITGGGYSDNYTMSRVPSSAYSDSYATASPRMSRAPRSSQIYQIEPSSHYQYDQEGIYEPAVHRGYRTPSSSRHLSAYNRYI